MSETADFLTEAAKVAEQFKAKGTFSLAERLKGRGFPTEEINVYLNEDAGYQLVRLMDQEQPTDEVALEAFNALVQQVTDEVQESRLTLSLRGISTGHIKQIGKNLRREIEASDEAEGYDFNSVDFENRLFYRHVAPHIVRITDYSDDYEERMFEEDDVRALHETLPRGEWDKIVGAVHRLSFASNYFEQATDAGFLPRS